MVYTSNRMTAAALVIKRRRCHLKRSTGDNQTPYLLRLRRLKCSYRFSSHWLIRLQHHVAAVVKRVPEVCAPYVREHVGRWKCANPYILTASDEYDITNVCPLYLCVISVFRFWSYILGGALLRSWGYMTLQWICVRLSRCNMLRV